MEQEGLKYIEDYSLSNLSATLSAQSKVDTQLANDLRATIGNLNMDSFPDALSQYILKNNNGTTGTWTTTAINNSPYNQTYWDGKKYPSPSKPIEKFIFPFRENTVYKYDGTSSYHIVKIANGKVMENGVDEDIHYSESAGAGVIPEQVLVTVIDRIQTLNTDEESEEYKSAIKHMQIALAYMEKYTMNSFNKPV